MKDRVPANPGRVLITPENGSAPFYATMARADNPTQEGDPLDKNTLLKDATAAMFGKGTDALPDQILSVLSKAALWKQSGHDPIYTVETRRLSEVSVGEKFLFFENGSPVEYYVAQKNYQSGLNGAGRTLLVRSSSPFGTTFKTSSAKNEYENSILDQALVSFVDRFQDSVKEALGPTKIPHVHGNGDYTVTTLERKCFALSATEFGRTSTYVTVEGSELPIASTLRTLPNYYQWTRSPSSQATSAGSNVSVCAIDTSGYIVTTNDGTSSYHILPAITLPDSFSLTVYKDSGGNYHAEQAYTDSIHELTDVLGNGLNTPKIETGSYIGTGLSGSTNKVTITYVDKPKIFIVYSVGISTDGSIAFLAESSPIGVAHFMQSSLYTSNLTVSWTDNTVSFYSNNANQMLNVSGKTYKWIAFG